tara:strand:- start:192 stop:554 length:363 start_codon:yes stop_codon:yes gene_type:complete
MANYRYQNPATTDATQACQQCDSIYISTGRPVCDDFCDGVNNYAISNQILSPHNYAGTTLGDVITPDDGDPNFTAGYFYAYAATSTDTATGTYRILKIDATIPNYISDIKQCTALACASL